MWVSFFLISVLFWAYNLYYQYATIEVAQTALSLNPSDHENLKRVYLMLQPSHFFSNIIVSDEPPHKKAEADFYYNALPRMKAGSEIIDEQAAFFKMHISFWNKAIEESKIGGNGKFIEQDRTFLNILLEVNRTATHNGLIWSGQLSLISIILFITWIFSHLFWKKKE
jgi:hypothetical protein